jgi:hypothetical protein
MVKHIEVSDDLHRRIKTLSAVRGVYMRELVALAVDKLEKGG